MLHHACRAHVAVVCTEQQCSVSFHAESNLRFLLHELHCIQPLCAGPTPRLIFLVEDVVKVAFGVPGTLLSRHIQPPFAGSERIWALWQLFLSDWHKLPWTGHNVGLLILNSITA